MATFEHKTDYRFYAQTLPVSTDGRGERIDIEETFNCHYGDMSGLDTDGACKNVYEEDYAERDGVRVYVPPKPVHEATDCELRLVFIGEDCLANEAAFSKWLFGRKFLWYDTFRQKFAVFTGKNQSTVISKKLYGPQRWIEKSYSLRNVNGCTWRSLVDLSASNISTNNGINPFIVKPTADGLGVVAVNQTITEATGDYSYQHIYLGGIEKGALLKGIEYRLDFTLTADSSAVGYIEQLLRTKVYSRDIPAHYIRPSTNFNRNGAYQTVKLHRSLPFTIDEWVDVNTATTDIMLCFYISPHSPEWHTLTFDNIRLTW